MCRDVKLGLNFWEERAHRLKIWVLGKSMDRLRRQFFGDTVVETKAIEGAQMDPNDLVINADYQSVKNGIVTYVGPNPCNPSLYMFHCQVNGGPGSTNGDAEWVRENIVSAMPPKYSVTVWLNIYRNADGVAYCYGIYNSEEDAHKNACSGCIGCNKILIEGYETA